MTAHQRAILANTQMTAAEKNAALLVSATAFRRFNTHNYTATPQPSKTVHVASSKFATA